MPEQLPRPSSQNNQVIDLTLSSDDEDEDNPCNARTAIFPPILPPKVDGLPRPFKVVRGQLSDPSIVHNNIERREYPPILPPKPTPRVTPIPLPIPKQQTLPGPARSTHQRYESQPASARQQQKRPSTTHLPNTGQPVKRRKIWGSMVAQGGHQASSSSSIAVNQQQQGNPVMGTASAIRNGQQNSPRTLRPVRSASNGKNEVTANFHVMANRVGTFITTYLSPLMDVALDQKQSKLERTHGKSIANSITNELFKDSRSIIAKLMGDPRFFAEHQAHNWNGLSPTYQQRFFVQVCEELDERAVKLVEKAPPNSHNFKIQVKNNSEVPIGVKDTDLTESSEGESDVTMESYSPPDNSTRSPPPIHHGSTQTRPKHPKAFDTSKLDLDRRLLQLAGLDINAPRPYISAIHQDSVKRGLEIALARPDILSSDDIDHLTQNPIHVDFCREEAAELLFLLNPKLGRTQSDPIPRIVSAMRGKELNFTSMVNVVTKALKKPAPSFARQLLQKRGSGAIIAFLRDAAADELDSQAKIVRIQTSNVSQPPPRSSISALLREREVGGRASARVAKGLRSFVTVVCNELEDSLALRDRWTDCCGDIFSLSWTSEHSFICGATAHSDFHNMQYNKPGNFAVGSTSQGTLRAIADHRIIRPIVGHTENAENASESMRRTQDPWLYTSVVSTAHSAATGYSFSASFDKTVKVWSVENAGRGMVLEGTWEHEAKVNFVVTSEYHRLVATSADVSNNAIRVYHLDEADITHASYDTYTGEKADEQAQELRRRDNWAYFPAAIQWGRAEVVSHLLLVGYSPRSMSGDDNDIPEDKRNTGELCMWNTFDGTKINITTARTQNVFEVIWHPTQPIFYAATSPCGIFEPETQTQIQVFAQNEFGTFTLNRALDCHACDINELTVMPNSIDQAYVTASCTDGNTYVWDTARGDRPIHILKHGEPIETPIHDLPRELADAGVKFAAWGKSSNRFYTGSSDGALKVWNIKAPRGQALLRTVLSIPAGISVGAFSADFSNLILGDSTGTVHLLSVNQESEEVNVQFAKQYNTPHHQPRQPVDNSSLSIRPPKVIIQHQEPGAPDGYQALKSEPTARETAKEFLDTNQLVLHPDRTVGVIKGPRYHETNFFRAELHEGGDVNKPLLPECQVNQMEERCRDQTEPKISCLPKVNSSSQLLHARNLELDFALSRLSVEDQEALVKEGIDFNFSDKIEFEYDKIRPHFSLFSQFNKKSEGKSRKASANFL